MEWIKCTDKLPPEDRKTNWCLVYMESLTPGMQAAVFNSHFKWMYDGNDITDIVTHWMPLPEPPQS